MKISKRLSLFVLSIFSVCLAADSAQTRKSASVRAESALVGAPFILESQRILLEVSFEGADGVARPALVWFNMGMAAPILTAQLYRELAVGQRRAVKIKVGDVEVEAPADTFVDGDGGIAAPDFAHLFAPRRVEAMLPASLLQKFAVTIDYGKRRLVIEESGRRAIEGVRVPIAVNSQTGVVAIEAEIDGAAAPIAIDAGSGYTWVRGDVSRRWLASNPEWRRADGAVGQANANMVDYAFEKEGVLFRIPHIQMGALTLDKVGALGTAPVLGSFAEGVLGDLFWDNWAKAAPVSVVGWLGGNVLRDFKLTIDYPNQMSYWSRQRASDAHDLDQVGITLVRKTGRYFVGGVARLAQTNRPAVDGLQINDELVAIDGKSIRNVGKDVVFSALRGRPGDSRRLTIESGGEHKDVEATVVGFE